jgi:hypothetical protein
VDSVHISNCDPGDNNAGIDVKGEEVRRKVERHAMISTAIQRMERG